MREAYMDRCRPTATVGGRKRDSGSVGTGWNGKALGPGVRSSGAPGQHLRLATLSVLAADSGWITGPVVKATPRPGIYRLMSTQMRPGREAATQGLPARGRGHHHP